jgi:hypothetical protein
MNESERMTDLILEAYQKCKDNGHRMDWRRYNNYHADANCLDCTAWVMIADTPIKTVISGSATLSNCVNKIVRKIKND